uniref:HSac2 domain-containing protein n=2 Tax=Eptatretus burgeri TaxID=7764 RepID=A0A8C4WV11_EPTBU
MIELVGCGTPDAGSPGEPLCLAGQTGQVDQASQVAVSVPGAAHTQKLREYFVFRPGAFDQAVNDIKSSIMDPEADGNLQSAWLLAEVDHWNNEKERLVLVTEHSLLVCKYDFLTLRCSYARRVPFIGIDTISTGEFTFPPKSLLKRAGLGVRIEWDNNRELPFTARWNPWSSQLPFVTFTAHPLANADPSMVNLCKLESFRDELISGVKATQRDSPSAGILVLEKPLPIDAYVGLVAAINNQGRLGYAMARGPVGF